MSLLRKIVLKYNLNRVQITFRRTQFCTSIKENIVSSNYFVDISDQTIPEYVYSKTSEFSKYTAIECPLLGKSVTFGQLRIKSRNFGKSLRKKLKLQNGDVIAIFMSNCLEFPIATLGTLEAGLVLTTLNPLYSTDEIARQFQNARPKAVITQYDLYPNIRSALEILKKDVPVICIKTKARSIPEGLINFDEFVNEHVDYPDFQPNNPGDLALLLYSSGTTGMPKGVMLSHANVVANLNQIDHQEYKVVNGPTDSFQSIIPAVLPLYHVYGFVVNMLAVLSTGGRLLPLPRFTPDSYISVLKRYDVTTILAAPPLILFLTSHPDILPKDLESLRYVMCGAAPLGISDEQRFLDKIGRSICIIQGYGLTEASPVLSQVTESLYKTRKYGGSIGVPIPNTRIKVVDIGDITGAPLGPNKSGELWAQGPQLMMGYYENPEETGKTLTKDGWLKTGDVAYYNEDGIFFITDRLKELIKVKGFQVPPAELEEVLRSFPNVIDAAVIGIPHSTYGEVPRAFVVPKPNKRVDVNELYEFVSKRVAPYKNLKGGIEIVDSIPKNPSGKILRRELKLKYNNKQ